MAIVSPDWSYIHQNKNLSFWSLFLAALSVPYCVGSQIRAQLYDKKIFKGEALPGFVMSVGNLTAGGTGKTPAVAMLSSWAREQGFRVAVLSRGYGGTYSEKVLDVSDGNDVKSDPGKTGDEVYLLANKLSGVPLVISKSRYSAGLYAHKKYGCDFFILDDGFQHLELKRNLDLVLMDASRPFGNGHLLPWGPLREPLSQLKRADVFILTRVSHHETGEKTSDFLSTRFPSPPIFYSDHRPSRVTFPTVNEKYEPGFLQGKSVAAFAGIATPEFFRETLMNLGAEVLYFRGFKDHYQFRRSDILNLIQIKEKVGAQYLITTEKDWMRIAPFEMQSPEIGYVEIDFAILTDHDRFFEVIKEKVTLAATC